MATLINETILGAPLPIAPSFFAAPAGTWSTPFGDIEVTAAIQLPYDIANHSDVQGAYYCEVQLLAAPASITNTILSTNDAANNGRVLRSETTRTRTRYTTDTAGAGVITMPVMDTTWTKFGVAYDQSTKEIGSNMNGAWVEFTTYGEFWSGTVLSLLQVDQAALIRNVRRYDLAYADAKAKIDFLMSL